MPNRVSNRNATFFWLTVRSNSEYEQKLIMSLNEFDKVSVLSLIVMKLNLRCCLVSDNLYSNICCMTVLNYMWNDCHKEQCSLLLLVVPIVYSRTTVLHRGLMII